MCFEANAFVSIEAVLMRGIQIVYVEGIQLDRLHTMYVIEDMDMASLS